MAETTGKEILDKVRTIKRATTDKDVLIQKNRATVAGGITGLLIGFYYGYAKKTNMLVTGLIGGTIGAVSTRLLMPKN